MLEGERETEKEERAEGKKQRYRYGEVQEMGRVYSLRVTLGQIKEV